MQIARTLFAHAQRQQEMLAKKNQFKNMLKNPALHHGNDRKTFNSGKKISMVQVWIVLSQLFDDVLLFCQLGFGG